MITIIYLGIALLVFVSTLYNLIFKEERIVDQINAAMILIPLLLIQEYSGFSAELPSAVLLSTLHPLLLLTFSPFFISIHSPLFDLVVVLHLFCPVHLLSNRGISCSFSVLNSKA